MQPRARHRHVRLHGDGEPLAKFRIGRGHWRRKQPVEITVCSRTVERIVEDESHPIAAGQKVYVMNSNANISVISG
jgi:hypothetical protein